jgi:tetratricopeptide (TPR) repeat protein
MPGREDIFQRAMNEGHSAAWDQMWDRAASAYQKALAEFPDNPKALNSLGLALYHLQRFDESVKVYLRAAQVTPEDPAPFEKLAMMQERQGNLREAIQASLQAAELFLKAREVEKAIENWLRVVQLSPDHAQARSRLALVHEKTGQTRQAVTEYLAVASILQNAGNPAKAVELLEHALQLEPNNAELRQALALVKGGKLLPKPTRPKGGTGPLRMAQIKQLEAPEPTKESPDPISEARKKALNVLADSLFELSDESGDAQARRGLQAIMRGTGALSAQAEQTKILLHLSQAIDAQTKNQDMVAADELERAIENGFSHPAGYFDLGYLRSKGERVESALRNFQQCNKHADYDLASRLLSGQILRKMNRHKEAAVEFLEALKIADASVVGADHADSIRQLYEPLIESLDADTDDKALSKLSDNIQDMLSRPNWRQHLLKLRQEMPGAEGESPLPLAEILIQAQSSHVIESMNMINQLARSNRLRSAMDEAFHALIYAPTYLPLHILIGDLLIRENRVPDAITKFTVVANAYGVRGEAAQATTLLKRIIQLSPMDLAARTRLIEQLTARGKLDEAIAEYLDLADIYYRLAELDMARKTYTTALRLAQQPNANRTWSVQILRRMADIDMQRLDWKQAIRVYEQIRTLRPDDVDVRINLIELSLRLAMVPQAKAELESFIAYLDANKRSVEVVPFLEKLLTENDHMILQRELAAQYHKIGRTSDAIAILDAIGDKLMEAGDKAGVADVVSQILQMNPPNSEEYRTLLTQLQGG